MKLAKNDTPPEGLGLPNPAHKRGPALKVLRSLDQILGIFENGDYQPEVLDKLAELHRKMMDHREQHRGKTRGSFVLTIDYELGKHGDVSMTSTCNIKPPKAPPSSAVAFITDDGDLTLFSPMLRQMEVRDTFDADGNNIR